MTFEIHKLQGARRAVQLTVIFAMLLVPAISRYANYVAADEIDEQIEGWEGSVQGSTIAILDSAFRSLPNGEMKREGLDVSERDTQGVIRHTQAFRGGPWSAELFGVSVTDPLGGLESIIARKHVAAVLALSLVVPVILTLIFGRVFCSWICPMGFILEMSDKLRNLLKFLEIKPFNIRFHRGTKFSLLAIGLFSTAILSVPILGYIYPPAMISREFHDLIFTLFDRAEAGFLGWSFVGLTWMSLILLGIILFEVFVSRRWWCRYVCPGGGVYIVLGMKRPIRVKLLESKCTRCVDCVVACPMGLNPMNNQMGTECDNCGACISSCHDDALKFSFALNDVSEKKSQPIAIPVLK